MTLKKQVGNLGENLVKDYLMALDYQIIAQQWHCPLGEIDLIVTNNEWLVFVEVKTRSVKNWDQDGLLAISAPKRQKLILTAQSYLLIYPEPKKSMRFDVALVQHDRGNYHIKTYLIGAFDS